MRTIAATGSGHGFDCVLLWKPSRKQSGAAGRGPSWGLNSLLKNSFSDSLVPIASFPNLAPVAGFPPVAEEDSVAEVGIFQQTVKPTFFPDSLRGPFDFAQGKLLKRRSSTVEEADVVGDEGFAWWTREAGSSPASPVRNDRRF